MELVEANSALQAFLLAYEQLLKSVEDVRRLKIEEFLSQSKRILDEWLIEENVCPLCLQPKEWEELKRSISKRLQELRQGKAQYEAALRTKGAAISTLQRLFGISDNVLQESQILSPEFDTEVRRLRQAVDQLLPTIQIQFQALKAISATEPLAFNAELLESEIANLDRKLEELKSSAGDEKLVDLVRDLESVRMWTAKYVQACQTKAKFERQIETLERLRSRFVAVQSTTLQKVLDAISILVSKYYLAMHPNETVDGVKLMMLNEGVEIAYGFHGNVTYPPVKYLSESHLNSLGIAVFLASAKIFNKLNKFFILDDVITSFDANHRFRLLRLLESEFSDWQILLLTHDRLWFDMIKRELVPQGWLATEIDNSSLGTVRLKSTSVDLKEEVEAKRASGSLTANDLRRLLERFLKELSCQLEVKLAFRFNDDNERRMSSELLSALRATLKKKSPVIASDAVFAKLETSSLITNTGSHDSGFVLSPGDLTVVYEDVMKLCELFTCQSCGRLITTDFTVGKVIHCKCGLKAMDWKE